MDGTVDVYVCSDLFAELDGELKVVLESVKCNTDESGTTVPTTAVFRFSWLAMLVTVKNIINNHDTEFISLLQKSSENDYKLLCAVAEELKAVLDDTLLDMSYEVNAIDRLAGNNFKINVSIDDEL